MEEVCGETRSRRKRVTLCRLGCQLCDAKSAAHGAQVGRKTHRVTGSEAAPRNQSMNDDFGRRGDGTGNFDETSCERCGLDDDDARMLLCDKCDRGFHIYCLNPVIDSVPEGNWFCPPCHQSRRILESSNVQTKIADFFRIQKFSSGFPTLEVKKRRRHSGGFTVHKKNRKLLSHVPSKDPERRLEQMASLARALAESGITFSDELTYFPGQAPRSSNSPWLEKDGMQVMGKDDLTAFLQYKDMCRMGYCPPLMVKYDVREGFVVEADSAIKDMTIIAEYTGDVDFMRNRLYDAGNSIMGLLFTKDPKKDLVICPDKRANLARFVSGINNHTPDGRKKLNVRCVRFEVNGEARALLVAIRDIPKDERLYYDYNGYQQDYPTENFV